MVQTLMWIRIATIFFTKLNRDIKTKLKIHAQNVVGAGENNIHSEVWHFIENEVFFSVCSN